MIIGLLVIFLSPTDVFSQANGGAYDKLLDLFEEKNTTFTEPDEEIDNPNIEEYSASDNKGFLKAEKGSKHEVGELRRKIEELNQTNKTLQRRMDALLSKKDSLDADAVAKLYEDLGTAYIEAKLYDKAIDAYLRVLEYTPRSLVAHYRLGLLYEYSKKDSKKALYHLSKFLKLGPEPKEKERARFLIKVIKKSD